MTDFILTGPEYLDDFVSGRRRDRAIVLEAHFSSTDHPAPANCRARAHIPGAIQVHPSYLEAGIDRAKYYPLYECPEDGNLLPRRQLTAALERLGITPDSRVIVYGSDPDGTMAAARLVWGLLYAGVAKIRLLDGGLRSWLNYGGRTISRIRKATSISGPAQGSGAAEWATQSQFLATTGEVRRIVQHRRPGPGAKLVDVRSSGEFTGVEQRYAFFSKAGRIPGAVTQGNWNCTPSNPGRCAVTEWRG